MRYRIQQLRYTTDSRYVLYATEPMELQGRVYHVCTRNLLVGTWEECMRAVPNIEKQRAWE